MKLTSRIAAILSIAVLALMAGLGIATATGYTDNNIANEVITVTTDSSGYTPLLGVGQTYGNFNSHWNGNVGTITVETESPLWGQSNLPYQHGVFYLDSGCHWKVRFLTTTGAVYVGSVTFRAISAYDGNQPAPIC